MKITILGVLYILVCGCTPAQEGWPMNNSSADFYMYGGDIESGELDVIRSCRKIGEITSVHGTQMLIVKISPGIATDPAFEGTHENIVGLTSRSTLYGPGEFGSDAIAGALLWKVERRGSGYKEISSTGLVTLWKSEADILKTRPSI
jgi:hypothetical protein